MRIKSRFVVLVAIVLQTLSATAQQTKPEAKTEQMQISTVTVTLMIKGAILALHQANVTGNYSVLRDLGTPIFRETFDQANLTAVFQNLRTRKIDLSPALLLSPNLVKNPEMNQRGELVLVGDFPTQPLRIHFELAFLQLDGAWRLAGMAVDAVPAQAMASLATPSTGSQPASAQWQPAPPSAGEKGKKKGPVTQN